MKDIIAAQRVQRRQGPVPSLLSTAMNYRVLPDNSFIADQRLPKRKKNKLLERIRAAASAGLAPDFRIRRKQGMSGESRDGASRIPGESRTGPGRAPGEKIRSLFLKKRFLMAVLSVSAAALALLIGAGYIPDPEPPEDARLPLASGGTLAGSGLSGGDEIPLDLTEVFAWQTYTVRSGDSVEAISKRFGLSLDAVIASNSLRDVRRLRAGETLRIPNMDGIPYTVKNGDSYAKIAKTLEVPLEAILDANDIQSDAISTGTVLFIPGARMDKNALRQALGELFIWPIRGRRSSPFGWRNDPFTGARSFHAGLDIAAPTGTPVKVSADGRVSATGNNAVYGNFIIVTHSPEYQTMYAHLSKIMVRNGQTVNQGTVIGQVGNTGRSTGAHLHFSVYKNKRAISPLEVLSR
ncbi:MAG: M23 family metallopeptidase [Treponema sp.]|jgi:murein DD-endopeptidase MepM/ murein hydrolase activator NlpD|nr:M23 family metallopeptidase [Treponema sp.]